MTLDTASDVIGFVGLGTLVLIFGFMRGARVAELWLAKRYEVALIWATACLHRGGEVIGASGVVYCTHIATAVMVALCALSAVWRIRPVSRGGLT